jgi:hypothetical protein
VRPVVRLGQLLLLRLAAIRIHPRRHLPLQKPAQRRRIHCLRGVGQGGFRFRPLLGGHGRGELVMEPDQLIQMRTTDFAGCERFSDVRICPGAQGACPLHAFLRLETRHGHLRAQQIRHTAKPQTDMQSPGFDFGQIRQLCRLGLAQVLLVQRDTLEQRVIAQLP